MEPILTLSCYLQLREDFRSSLTPVTGADRESPPVKNQNRMIETEASVGYLVEAPNSPASLETTSRGLVSLGDAFPAITEELSFYLPEPSPVDRIKAGFIEATIGLLLFLSLLVGLLLT